MLHEGSHDEACVISIFLTKMRGKNEKTRRNHGRIHSGHSGSEDVCSANRTEDLKCKKEDVSRLCATRNQVILSHTNNDLDSGICCVLKQMDLNSVNV